MRIRVRKMMQIFARIGESGGGSDIEFLDSLSTNWQRSGSWILLGCSSQWQEKKVRETSNYSLSFVPVICLVFNAAIGTKRQDT